MDIQDIIAQVEKAVQSDPSLIQKLTSNPAEAISGLTGQSVDANALQSIVSGLAGNDNGIDLSGIAADVLSGNMDNIASDVEKALGDNIADAAGDLLGGLFGNK